jgi:hypothetical protein
VPTSLPSATPTVTASATATQTAVPTLAATSASQPTKSIMPEVYGFTPLFISDTIYAGGAGYASIQTINGAKCTISVYNPRENFVMVNGPQAQTAGFDGVCAWKWVTPATVNHGMGYIKIESNGMSRTFLFTIP